MIETIFAILGIFVSLAGLAWLGFQGLDKPKW